jgi:hypothetical protein
MKGISHSTRGGAVRLRSNCVISRKQARSIATSSGVLKFLCEGPPLWPKWSEFLATNPEVPGSIPCTTRFSEKCGGLERGPLSYLNE